MMKRAVLALAGAGAIAIGAYTALTFRQRPGSYTVGAALPLTGDLAFFGPPQKYALKMAKEDLERRKILKASSLQFKFEDSRSTAKDGISAVRKLLPLGPKAVITSLTLVSMPVVPILSDLAIPQIALSVDPDIQNRASTVYRFYYGFEDEMKAIAEYAKDVNAKSVAIAWINTPELESSIERVLKPKLKSAGISLTGSSPHTFTTSDFRSIMIGLAEKKPDLIILQDFGPLLPAMVEAAKSQGIKNIVGGIGFMSSVEKERNRLAGIPFVLPKFLVDNNDSFQAFSNRFKHYSGGLQASYDVVFAYDAASILGTAISNSNRSSESLSNSLNKIKSFKGVAGDLVIDKRAMKVPLGWGKFSSEGKLIPYRINLP